ncbi:hypothetical protein GCM10010988_08660 [Cnuibacter physcomitrellae]|uniref:Uncharacterized protein n=1 Tax=Cnuibacter physcomitrellae TaxID=1619308 RepID=A0A1X9LRG6_9MICO|nr:DUF4245 domain-containing protein [Cnuibacter physcomitrellae]ARJ05739.1 hypothetical protein B5808_11275 [Cnuibacter physcomitrellae]GGI36380.1 hypothetical protein GCM10010988_08660 [Cnuibacter physcomitrellae]
MANASKPIVAELGRPETPEETAARQAEQSRLYRQRKTLNNLVLSLLVTVGLVVVIVLAVPRPATVERDPVDYAQVAQSVQSSMPVPLAVPTLPEGWTSNAAELRGGGADGVASWYVGLLTPGDSPQYVGLTQALDSNPTWLAQQLGDSVAAGTVDLGGVTWTVFDNRGRSGDFGNNQYALEAESGRSTYIVAGTATPEEVQQVASSIASDVLAQPDASGD